MLEKQIHIADDEERLIYRALVCLADDCRWRASCMECYAGKYRSERNKQMFLGMAAEDNECADKAIELRNKLKQQLFTRSEKFEGGIFKCPPRGTVEKNILTEITRRGMTVKDVSRKTCISEKALYAAFEGRSELRLGYFLTICRELKLDPWEMAGKIGA